MEFSQGLEICLWLSVIFHLSILYPLRNALLLRKTTDLPSAPNSFKFPKISYIIPSCNEEDTIGPALDSLLATDYPNIEIIVVNDRSADRTGEVIEERAKDDSRIKVLNIEVLPEGWLGKVHALHQGTQLAQGDYLAFVDADIHLKPGIQRKIMVHLVQNGLDSLSVVANIKASSSLLQNSMSLVLTLLMVHCDVKKIRHPKLKNGIALGAYCIVSRAFFEKTPGFKDIRLHVLDDLSLGQMLKKCGGKLDLIRSLDNDVRVEWYPNVPALVRGFEKNLFATFDYSVLKTSLSIFAHISSLIVILIGISLGHVPSLIAAAIYIGCVAFFARANKFSFLSLIWTPITRILLMFVLFRSSWLTLKNKGIRWRGTYYPLKELRQHQSYSIRKGI